MRTYGTSGPVVVVLPGGSADVGGVAPLARGLVAFAAPGQPQEVVLVSVPEPAPNELRIRVARRRHTMLG